MNGSGAQVSSWSFLLRGIVAAFRREIHLSPCPNFPGRLLPPTVQQHSRGGNWRDFFNLKVSVKILPLIAKNTVRFHCRLRKPAGEEMSVGSAIHHLCALVSCVICWMAMSPQASAQDYAAQYEEGLRKRDYVLLSHVFTGAAAQNNHAVASGALVAISLTPLTMDSTQSCVSTIGKEKAGYLARVCGMISPATHPPCNVANSCKLIADEVVRGCQLAAQMGQPDAFCPPFLTMAGGAQPANAASNTTPPAAATANKSASAPIPTTATEQEHRAGLVK
ncbi:hypothetical protein [Phaeospirillum tilakii]|uniref:Cysteine rich repeat-containing protein n=1 Tax=Phaeospirillum tilakii TaxID=741673 RepID=A0ABW5CI70_9PROT